MDTHLESRRLAALEALDILDTAPEDEFTELVQLAAAICGVPTSVISLIDENRQFHKAMVGIIDVDEIPRSISFCDHTIRQNGVMIVEDTTRDSRFAQSPFVTAGPEIRFYAGATLTTEDGFNIGALCVLDQAVRTLSEQQSVALATLARQVVARMELRQKRALLDETMQELRNREVLFRTFADNIPFNTFLKDPSGAYAFYNKHFAEHFKIGPTDWVGRRLIEIFPHPVAEEFEKRDLIPRSTMKEVDSTAAFPTESGGVSHWRIRQVPYETEPGKVWLAGVAVDVTEQVEREAMLLQTQATLREANAMLSASALTDELTGLWNRRAFNLRVDQEVAAARRIGSPLGLMMLDVDNFKSLNDTFGHPFGDQVLRRLGALLAKHVRVEDVACRYGGEEFVLLLPRADQTALQNLADRILNTIAHTDWPERKVTISLGLAVYSTTLHTAQLLVDAADAALYDAKSAGKACWRFRHDIDPVVALCESLSPEHAHLP